MVSSILNDFNFSKDFNQSINQTLPFYVYDNKSIPLMCASYVNNEIDRISRTNAINNFLVFFIIFLCSEVIFYTYKNPEKIILRKIASFLLTAFSFYYFAIGLMSLLLSGYIFGSYV